MIILITGLHVMKSEDSYFANAQGNILILGTILPVTEGNGDVIQRFIGCYSKESRIQN